MAVFVCYTRAQFYFAEDLALALESRCIAYEIARTVATGSYDEANVDFAAMLRSWRWAS